MLLCILILGGGGFFIAINNISPSGQTSTASLEPAVVVEPIEPPARITRDEAFAMVITRVIGLAQTPEAKEYVAAFLSEHSNYVRYEELNRYWVVQITGVEVELVMTRDWFPVNTNADTFRDDHWWQAVWLVYDDGRIKPMGKGLIVEADIDRLNSYRTLRSLAAPAPILKYDLSVRVNPSGGGTVSPSSGTYDSDTQVTLIATPSSDYEFDQWSGTDNDSINPTTVTMDSNKSVVANFIKRYQRIEDTMPAGSIGGSEVIYSKALKTGDKVDGFVQLTGKYHSTDWSYEWTFQIIGPGGESIRPLWKGNWVNNNYHEFSFTASYAGAYKIRVYHASSYSKNVTIEIWPPSWGYSGS